jgi:hypothetical protein
MKGVESAFWEMAYQVKDELKKVLEISRSREAATSFLYVTLSK